MQLFQHQLDIIRDDKKKAGLFLGTGSGKTLTALLLARGKTLVICPKTTRDDQTWPRQMAKANLSLELTVMSKEEFRRDWERLPRFQTVIVDEAHTVAGVLPAVRWRNKRPIPRASQLFEALDDFLTKTSPERFYALTATPTRSAMVVWGLQKLLGGSWDFDEFRRAFYVRINVSGREVWVPKTDIATRNRLAKCVKNLGYTGRLADWFDVPSQVFKNVFVELTKKQRDRIKRLQIEFPDPLVLLGKTLQVENGVLSGDEFSAPESFPNEKLDKIIDFAYEFPRMVIFSKYLAQIEQIKEALEGIGKKVFIMTGETKDRGELLAQLNKMDEYVFIVSAQISMGWELPKCEVVVFASRTYSIVDLEQSIGRVHRANAIKKNLYITLVTRGGIDEEVHKCLETKKDFNERIFLKHEKLSSDSN
jgi:superfamily II DNA or RNA helicase